MKNNSSSAKYWETMWINDVKLLAAIFLVSNLISSKVYQEDVISSPSSVRHHVFNSFQFKMYKLILFSTPPDKERKLSKVGLCFTSYKKNFRSEWK